MAETLTDVSPLEPLDGGPYDVEFFFDPGCPWAWQTSRWIRRIIARRGIQVGWRFISLAHINAGKERSEAMRNAHAAGRRFHRICAAARDKFGNDAVADLYHAYGERYWSVSSDAPFEQRLAVAAAAVDPVEILDALGLPTDLADAADDDRWDDVLAIESDEAFRRTGPDVGTPILTYDPPTGNSLFGPIISALPDDERAVAFYDALRTFVDFPEFSELKRSNRPPLDLPLFAR